jgi:hypothetical protein
MRALAIPLASLCMLSGGGCTLVKPLAGAVAGPVVMLGTSTGGLGYGFGCGGEWQGIAGVLVVGSAVGAVCGVFTGIVSDVQALTGAAEDPCRNWWNPLATNTMPEDDG